VTVTFTHTSHKHNPIALATLHLSGGLVDGFRVTGIQIRRTATGIRVVFPSVFVPPVPTDPTAHARLADAIKATWFDQQRQSVADDRRFKERGGS
jgi:hypothetical protein